MPIPDHFKYKDIAERGKPAHKKDDPFRARHPAMPLSRRAKIFAPFDALKGFREAVEAEEKKNAEE